MEPASTSGWERELTSSRQPLRVGKLVWLVRIAGVLAVIAFTGLGLFWVDRSVDLPWPDGNVRYGFYGNAWPKIWVCADGHDHRSIPFWAGGLAAAVLVAPFWLFWPRPGRRSRSRGKADRLSA